RPNNALGSALRLTQPASALGHAPEERDRPAYDSVYVASPRLVTVVETGGDVDHVLHGRRVDAADDGLLVLQRLGLEPRLDLLLDGRDIGPAEPGLLAVGAQRVVGRRRGAVGAGVPSVEHAPAALARR